MRLDAVPNGFACWRFEGSNGTASRYLPEPLKYVIVDISLFDCTEFSAIAECLKTCQSSVFSAERVSLRNAAIRNTSHIASIPEFHHTDNVLTNPTTLQLIAELPENVEISSTNSAKCLGDFFEAGESCMLSLGVAC